MSKKRTHPIYENGLLLACWSLVTGEHISGDKIGSGRVTHIVHPKDNDRTLCGIEELGKKFWDFEIWDSIGRGEGVFSDCMSINHIGCKRCQKSAALMVKNTPPNKSITERVEHIKMGDVLYYNGMSVVIKNGWFEDDGDEVFSVYVQDAGKSISVERADLVDSDGTPVITWKCIAIHDGDNRGNRGTWFTEIGDTIHVRTGRDGDDHYYKFPRTQTTQLFFESFRELLHDQAWMYTNHQQPHFVNPMKPLHRVITGT